ncbi:MAG TPA: glycoside hydrolase family 15 protein [Terriglobales bacterium]|nr:glycoside hydrolase family 15 protein [Terriglobales bacterium]
MNKEQNSFAPGAPGIEPRWTRGAKDAVGTAYSTSSRVWYTVASGALTEVYYPTIDQPQIRDMQFMITDGESFFHDERRSLDTQLDCISESALGFEIVNTDPQKRYCIRKTIIGDPHQNCVLTHARLSAAPELLSRLQLFVLCAPHLQIGGWHNNGEVLDIKGKKILVAYKDGVWLALGGTNFPFLKCSCGYVGRSDGWTDLNNNYKMDWEYSQALDGNIALTAQLDLSLGTEFTLGLAFGQSRHDAVTCLVQSISIPFATAYEHFVDQWHRTSRRFSLVSKLSDGDSHYRVFSRSVNLLLAHEDKLYPGAMIASLSIPWGQDKGDDELGGYHLVWTRDMVNLASALLAVGDVNTPLRALIYLAVSQRADGGFYQNFWIDGRPYWTGVQLDEVSFPILLAWRLKEAKALENFDPYLLVLRACEYLIRKGPATKQDRWEEAGGYSPYTLAVNITALICAADFIEEHGDSATAEFVREYADFLEAHVEPWTVTTQGTLVPGISRHYIRINPASSGEGSTGDEDPNTGIVTLANRPPGTQTRFPARDIVDPGFLELVRFGIRRADDPLIVDSLRVCDAILKVETPLGPSWHRYNHDGYGDRDDGSSFSGWGVGRLWPLLTGERGHYEIAAGRDAEPYIHAMENFSNGIGLIPEQVWDQPDNPKRRLFLGRPTGAAIPLMWAHAEYIKLLRSQAEGRVFDCLPLIHERYAGGSGQRKSIEVWKFNRQVRSVPAGGRLRILAASEFILHWTKDEWETANDTHSTATSIGIHFVDIAISSGQKSPVRFTFRWVEENAWQGADFKVEIRP